MNYQYSRTISNPFEKLDNEESEEIKANFDSAPEEHFYAVYFYSGRSLIDHIYALYAEIDKLKQEN